RAQLLRLSDDERSDEERERDYWECFEPIETSEEVERAHEPEPEKTEEPEPEFEVIPFRDDEYIPLVQDCEPLSRYMRSKVRRAFRLLPPRYQKVLADYLFLDKVYREIGLELKVSHSRIGQMKNRALRVL